MRATFHIIPVALWAAADPAEPYVAASIATEGFVHCTDGVGALGETFDRHYAGDPRAFLVLTLDLDGLDVPWRYDAPGLPYPHIYGSIARPAILGTMRVERDEHGRFAGFATG
jgi:uncharacterized protein (DUF952 family)